MLENLLYKNKYRIPSARREKYDYSQNGFYFITICTKNRELFFGNIINEKIQLSKIGQITQKYWLEIPNHFSFVKLDEFIIMPNHVHGIIQIDNQMHCVKNQIPCRDAIYRVSKNQILNNQNPGGITRKYNPMLANSSLSKILRWFKGRTTFEIRAKLKLGEQNGDAINRVSTAVIWQSRFHDRIIRNDEELNKIRCYIQINPEKWEYDRNNPRFNL